MATAFHRGRRRASSARVFPSSALRGFGSREHLKVFGQGAAHWDACWKIRLSTPFDRTMYEYGRARVGQELIEEMQRAGRERVLFAANGVSLEPFGFAHAGFDVTALDISSVAADHLAGAEIDARALDRLLAVRERREQGDTAERVRNEAATRKRVHALHRPGGVLRSVSADLLRHRPPASYDVIASNLPVFGFGAHHLEELARLLHGFLADGGLCVMASLPALDRPTLERVFQKAGFVIQERPASFERGERRGVILGRCSREGSGTTLPGASTARR